MPECRNLDSAVILAIQISEGLVAERPLFLMKMMMGRVGISLAEVCKDGSQMEIT